MLYISVVSINAYTSVLSTKSVMPSKIKVKYVGEFSRVSASSENEISVTVSTYNQLSSLDLFQYFVSDT